MTDPTDDLDPFAKVGRPSRTPYVLLVLVVLVAALVLWKNLDDDRPQATAGKAIEASDPIDVAHQWTVLSLHKRLDVGATGVLDDVPDDLAAAKTQAPDDGGFIGIRLRETTSTDDQPLTFGGNYQAPPRLTAAVHIGAHTYPLNPGEDPSENDDLKLPIAVYLPVSGHPSSAQLVFSLGGHTQSIDLLTGKRQAGEFTDLYTNHAALGSCGAMTMTAGYSAEYRPATCRYAALRYPYVEGMGWAPKGRAWLVVDVVTTWPVGIVANRDRRHYYADYDPDRDPPHRLDGTKALGDEPYGVDKPSSHGDALLWSVPASGPAHALTLIQHFYAEERTPRSNYPLTAAVTDTWKVTIR